MEKFTRTTVVKNQRADGRTTEEDARGVLAQHTPDVTVDDLGGEALALRTTDGRDTMVAAVREEAANLARFTVTENPDEVIEEPVAPAKDEAIAIKLENPERVEQVEIDERLQFLVVDPINALPEAKRTVRGKVRSGEEIARAIPDTEAFLTEVNLQKKKGIFLDFFELNEAGQLVMKDDCKEAYGLGENALQARMRQTRIVYTENGQTKVMTGEEYYNVTSEDEQALFGRLEVSQAGKEIAPYSILMARGLPTLKGDGEKRKHIGEYARMSTGQLEIKTETWTDDDSLDASRARHAGRAVGPPPLETYASPARHAAWLAVSGGVISSVHNSGVQADILGSRGVLRVKLYLESYDAGKLVDDGFRAALNHLGTEDPSREETVRAIERSWRDKLLPFSWRKIIRSIFSPPKNHSIPIEMEVAERRKDYDEVVDGTDGETLSGVVENEPFTEAEMEEKQAVEACEGPRSEYDAFIDGLNFPEADAMKLKEMMTEANYKIAVETARELKASRIPTYGQIIAELMTFTPERLKDICEEVERPTIVIDPDRSFDENIASMDENKHYTSADGKPQEDTHVYRGPNSPYNNLKKRTKVNVGITDGIPHPEQLTGVSSGLRARRDHLIAKLEAKNMRLIGANEMTGLLQQSLKRAEEAGDNSLIVDNWKNGEGTVTILDPSDLTDSTQVAYSGFTPYNRLSYFGVRNPDVEGGIARGRAWVQVLEI